MPSSQVTIPTAAVKALTTAPNAVFQESTAHYYSLGVKAAKSPQRKLYVEVEDDGTAGSALDVAEFEVWGYMTTADRPRLAFKALVSGPGDQVLPFNLDSPNLYGIYVKQGTEFNAASTTGNPNPAFKYRP